MKMDFHCHTKLSKKFKFSLDRFKKIVKTAEKNGLDAIALTEHFHTINFYNIYQTLDQHYEYQNDYYDVNGFKVFCGMEVDIQEVGHIVVVGTKESLLDLRRLFPEAMERSDFPKLVELLDEVEKRNMIAIGAHPAKESKYLLDLDPQLLKRLDGLGLNGKLLKLKDKVIEFADKIDLPVVAGSDTHHAWHMGTVKNNFAEDYDRIADIKKAIKNREFKTEISNGAEVKAFCGQVAKKLLKKMKIAGII